jgi:hypothetical protein
MAVDGLASCSRVIRASMYALSCWPPRNLIISRHAKLPRNYPARNARLLKDTNNYAACRARREIRKHVALAISSRRVLSA